MKVASKEQRLRTHNETTMHDQLYGSKMRKKLGNSLQEQNASGPSKFAKAQLEKMGWTEGTGLGKRRDGIKTHLSVKRRAEQAGLGTEDLEKARHIEQNHEWWKDSLSDVYAKLSSKKKKRKTFTDEELFQATGGARFGMRAGVTKNLHKWTRTESSNTDTTAPTSESETEAAGATATSAIKETTESSKEHKKKKKDKKKKKKDKKKRKESNKGVC